MPAVNTGIFLCTKLWYYYTAPVASHACTFSNSIQQEEKNRLLPEKRKQKKAAPA